MCCIIVHCLQTNHEYSANSTAVCAALQKYSTRRPLLVRAYRSKLDQRIQLRFFFLSFRMPTTNEAVDCFMFLLAFNGKSFSIRIRKHFFFRPRSTTLTRIKQTIWRTHTHTLEHGEPPYWVEVIKETKEPSGNESFRFFAIYQVE